MKFFNLFFALALCCTFVACSDLDEPQDQMELESEDRTIDVCRRLLTVAPNTPPPMCNTNLGITIVGYDLSSGQCCIILEFPHEGPWDWCMVGPETGPPFLAQLVNVIGPLGTTPVYQERICVNIGSNNLLGIEDLTTGQCQSLTPTGC